MKLKPLSISLVLLAIIALTGTEIASAKKLVSEARSVIQGIQEKGNTLNAEIAEFHQEFSSRAAKMVELEALMEDLKREGHLGENYADTPEKYERIYAEFAQQMSELKDIFKTHYLRIQNAVSGFNKSIYRGKDRIAELRSDDLAVVQTELARSKQEFQEIQNNRANLESNCPRDSNQQSRSCQRQWRNYQRQLNRLKQNLARLRFMQKVSNLKDRISEKLAQIMEQYVYKESDTVAVLTNYAFNFEQYAGFIGSNNLGGMLTTIRELSKLEETLSDLEQFQKGIDIHVTDIGNLVDQRLDNFIRQSGMNDVMESRGDVLANYADQEDNIAEMIRALEKETR